MKKVGFMIGAFVLTGLLCACSGGSGAEGGTADTAKDAVTEVGADVANNTADEEAEKEAVTEPKEESSAGNGSESPSYADIYKAKIEELSSSGQADLFALVNVDDDDTPELAAISSEGAWDKDQVFLFTYDGTEAVLLASDIGPGMEGHSIAFFEKKNVFVKSGAAMGVTYTFYKIENSDASEILSGSSFEMTDADGNDISACTINGNEASAEEYIAALKEIIPSAKMTVLAEEGSSDLVSYNVSLDDGYMDLTDAETTPYYSSDEIIELLK